MNNGLKDLSCKAFLESVLGALYLPSLDIKHFARSCLSVGQYLNFYDNLQELAGEKT